MNQITTSQVEKRRGPLRILQVIFTWLAFMFLVLGSVSIGLTWVGSGNINWPGVVVVTTSGYEGRFIGVILFIMATLFIVWLLSTIALLLAKQWIAALLALPAAFVILIVSYLFIVFFMAAISGPIFVLSLILLNGVALWLVILFLKRTSSHKKNRENTNAK